LDPHVVARKQGPCPPVPAQQRPKGVFRAKEEL
jgi:hypothetical protein